MKLFYSILMSVILGFSADIQADIATTQIKIITIDHYLRFTGTVEAVNQGTASAQTSGRVVETRVDVGDLVQKDTIILRLRDTQQQANLQTAQAGVKAAQAQFDSAEKEYQRIKEVRERELVAQSALDNALANRDAARASLDAANAHLNDAKEQLEFTRVRAPYSGIVLERHIEVGELVNPGTPLYTGMSLERLRVIADVPQKDIDAIRIHKNAQIELPDGDSLMVSADDLTFFGYAEPTTSTFKIRTYLPAAIDGLYPGMYLPTYFKVGVKEVLVVPQAAVINRGAVTAIYIQNQDKIHLRQIKTGRAYESNGQAYLQVLSGLAEGEMVIIEPASAIALIKAQNLAATE